MKSRLILGSINITMVVITSAYLGITLVGVATFFLDGSFLALNLLTGFSLESFDRLIFFAS